MATLLLRRGSSSASFWRPDAPFHHIAGDNRIAKVAVYRDGCDIAGTDMFLDPGTER